MDSNKELIEYLDQQRWLLNNGIVSDNVKNQLFFCGSIVHKDVRAVSLDIDTVGFQLKYKIYVDGSLIKKMNKYQRLSKATGIFDMWRFKRLLQKEGSLDFKALLTKVVSGFCGPKWSIDLQVLDIKDYIEDKVEGYEPDRAGIEANRQAVE